MQPYKNLPSAINTGKSIPVRFCQNCANPNLSSILFLGFLPPVNKLIKMGKTLEEQPSYPAQLLYCNNCQLVQLGLIVDPNILFPKEYPYTSGTTKVLRDNFAELYKESSKILKLKKNDLIIDIGSNDGTLLLNFKNNHRVLGITPEDVGKDAIEKGIPTEFAYFSKKTAQKVKEKYGKAKLITAANVFAHMEQIHDVADGILLLLEKDGVFISESHYLLPLLEMVQYDTIYHEHMRYYSLISLKNLLESHGLEVFHAKEIPSHGGSIRVYAARKGVFTVQPTVKKQLAKEKKIVSSKKAFTEFAHKTLLSKLALSSLILKIKKQNKAIYGISAPSRGSTLINYTGIDENILTCIVEVKGSYKIGNFAPGTLIPILDEEILFKKQPEYVLLLSWHIAKELMPKLKKKGYKGDFIIPLPYPKIVPNKKVNV
jgi:hypothetical protein